MPKVSVYLPDDLYRAAHEQGLPLSTLTQVAIKDALRAARTDRWVEQVRARPARVETRIDTRAALAEAREEFGA